MIISYRNSFATPAYLDGRDILRELISRNIYGFIARMISLYVRETCVTFSGSPRWIKSNEWAIDSSNLASTVKRYGVRGMCILRHKQNNEWAPFAGSCLLDSLVSVTRKWDAWNMRLVTVGAKITRNASRKRRCIHCECNVYVSHVADINTELRVNGFACRCDKYMKVFETDVYLRSTRFIYFIVF